MQTNWIGRSEGVDVEFDISEYGLHENVLSTFTTRIDTIFGSPSSFWRPSIRW